MTLRTSIKDRLFRATNTAFKRLYAFSRPFHRSSEDIAIIRTDNLGDLIIFAGCLPAYRQLYQGKKLVLFVSDAGKEFAEAVLGANDLVDQVVAFDRERFSRDPFYFVYISIKHLMHPYAIAVNTVSSRRTYVDVLMNIINARRKIGTSGDYSNADKDILDKRAFIYDQLISTGEMRHELDKNRRLISELAGTEIQTKVNWLEDYIPSGNGRTLIPEQKERRYCVIFPGGAKVWRRWPARRFAEIAVRLEQAGIAAVICGNPPDQEACREVLAFSAGSIDATSKLTIIDLAMVLRDSLFYFGNDTGIAHLAMAVGTKTVCVLGLGHFGRFFPYPDRARSAAVFDRHAACMGDNWACIQGRTDRPAPCIESVTSEDAWKLLAGMIQCSDSRS